MEIPSLQHIEYMAYRIRAGRPERLVVFMESRLRHYALESGSILYDIIFEFSDDVLACARDGSLFVVDTPKGPRIIDSFGTTVQELGINDAFLKEAYFEADTSHLYFVYRRPSTNRSTVDVYRRGGNGMYRRAEQFSSLRDFLWMSLPHNTIVTRRTKGKIHIRSLKDDQHRSLTRALVLVDDTSFLAVDTGQTVWCRSNRGSSFSIPFGFSELPCGTETWQLFLRNRAFMIGDNPVYAQDIDRAGKNHLLVYDTPCRAAAAGNYAAVANNHGGKLTVFNLARSFVPAWIDRRRVMEIDAERIHSNPWGWGVYCVVKGNKLGHIHTDNGRAAIDMEIKGGVIIDFAFAESESQSDRFLLVAVEPRTVSVGTARPGVSPMRSTAVLIYRFIEPHRMDMPIRYDIPLAVHSLSAAGSWVAMILRGYLRGRHLGVFSFGHTPVFSAVGNDAMKARLRVNRYAHMRVDTAGTIYILTGQQRILGQRKSNSDFEQQSSLQFKNEYSYYRVSVDGVYEVFAMKNPNIVLIVRRGKVFRKLSPWGWGTEYLSAPNGDISDVRLTASSKYILIALGHREHPAILAYEVVTGTITRVLLERSWSNTEYLMIEPLHSEDDDLFVVGRIPQVTSALKVYSITRESLIAEYSFPADLPVKNNFLLEDRE